MTELEKLAKSFQGFCMSCDVTKPGGGVYSDYNWRLDKNFPVSAVQGERGQWVKWFHVWREIYIADGNDHLGFILDYVSRSDEPIVIVKWRDGLFYIWDGNHRIAASHLLGKDTINAVVGELKDDGANARSNAA